MRRRFGECPKRFSVDRVCDRDWPRSGEQLADRVAMLCSAETFAGWHKTLANVEQQQQQQKQRRVSEMGGVGRQCQTGASDSGEWARRMVS
jgi:hypothetical protein